VIIEENINQNSLVSWFCLGTYLHIFFFLKLERSNAFSSICQATPVVAYLGHRMNTQCIGLSEEVLMSLFLFLFFCFLIFSYGCGACGSCSCPRIQFGVGEMIDRLCGVDGFPVNKKIRLE
jgi:hypothetical protein